MMIPNFALNAFSDLVTKLVREFNPPQAINEVPLNAYEKAIYRKGFYEAVDKIYAGIYEMKNE